MIIVNQDKDEIINFDNISSIVINDAWDDKPGQVIIAINVRGNKHTLGYYKSEERAKEVLQEIYKVKSDFELIKNTRDNIQRDLIVGNKQDFFDVYEMPKE